jgi:hypothetical protein
MTVHGDRAERVTKWSTAGVVVGVAAVASYDHAVGAHVIT